MQMQPFVEQMRLGFALRAVQSPLGDKLIFSSAFRFPTKLYDHVPRPHFKPFGMYLNRGVSGHAVGKSLYRAGAPLDLGIHFATPPDRLGLSVEQLDASLRDQNAEFFEMAALAYWGD